MLGVLVNTGTVILGSLIGLLLKKGIPERVSRAVMSVIGLCTLIIGISGALQSSNVIVIILSLVIGTVVGTLLKIEDGINKLTISVERKFKKEGGSSIAEGLVTGTLLFCVGAMTITGAFYSANGDHSVYYTKSVLDLISSCVLASTLGIGVLFSSVALFIIQAGLVLLAGVLQGIMTSELIAVTCATGGVIIIGLGLNLIGVTKFKIADMLPSFLVVPGAYYLAILLGI